MGLKRENKYEAMGFDHSTPDAWLASVRMYLAEWVELHKDADHDDLFMNGCEITEPSMGKLPGYLEGGYEPGRYVVSKADGSPTDPAAKYMVVRFDKDPHAVVACMAYAVSVLPDNVKLHDGILEAIGTELGLDPEAFKARHGRALELFQAAIRPDRTATHEGLVFKLETGG